MLQRPLRLAPRSPSSPPGDGRRDGPAAAAHRSGGRDVAGRRAGLCSRRGAGGGRARRGTSSRPGNFTGYGFDQCHAPDQRSMNRWLTHSPFLAVGIYISGNSRACRDQPNLTPPVDQHPAGQGLAAAADHPRPAGELPAAVPALRRRPEDQPQARHRRPLPVGPRPGHRRGDQDRRRRPGAGHRRRAAPCGTTSRASTTTSPTAASRRWPSCRSWTDQLHALGYVSGVYSSAGSGIEMLDDARVERPGQFSLPDQIWIARWDLQANTSTSYIREDGWLPGGRMKQYQGGHDETWGGVRINIDRNYLDLGLGSVATRETHCGGTRISYWRYRALDPGSTAKPVAAPCSACSRRRARTPARSPACTTRPPSPRPPPG